MSKLTVFIPVYNEEGSIKQLITEWYVKVYSKIRYKMLVADDGSTDFTRARLSEVRSPDFNFSFNEHQGYLGIIRNTLPKINSKYIFFSDGDGQYNPEDFFKFYQLKDNFDLIYGVKNRRIDSQYRVCFSLVYNLLIRILFRIEYKDMDSGFRLMNSSLKGLPIKYLKFSPLTEQIIRAHFKGYKIKSVSIQHRKRIAGKPKLFKPYKIINMIASQIIGALKLWKELRSQ